jgi:hypothetical protein
VKWRGTILVFVLALLGVGAMLRSIHAGSATAPPAAAQRLLIQAAQLPIDQLEKIALNRAQDAWVFVRSGTQWQQSAPFAYPMDGFSIRQLAEQALRLHVIEKFDPASLPASLTIQSLQLDPPAATITYSWPGGSLTLRLGKLSLAGRAFLQIQGDPAVYIVDQSLHDRAVRSDPKEWRDRAIFQNVGIDADRIERFDGDQHVTLIRERKLWMMTEPLRTRLDPGARDALLQELGRARVAGFILDQPSDLSKFGLDKPLATLAIFTGGPGGTTQRLLVGAAMHMGSQDRFAMIEGRPVVIKIAAMSLGLLFRAPQTLAAATASGVQAADVKSIVIRRGDFAEDLRFERDLERWLAPSRGGVEIPPAYLEELLAQLTTLKAPEVRFGEYPRDQEIATITVYGFDGKALDTVRIAQEKATEKIMLENGDSVLRVFPPGMKMRLKPADFGLQ